MKAILDIANKLAGLFPEPNHSVEIAVRPSGISINIHGLPDYATGVAILRRFGIGERQKQSHLLDNGQPWCMTEGDIEGTRITISCYCAGLPNTCAIKVEKRTVPKMTVVAGEFEEIETRTIVCGDTLPAGIGHPSPDGERAASGITDAPPLAESREYDATEPAASVPNFNS